MTVENQVYGVVDWIKCANCGVTQPLKSLVKSLVPKRSQHLFPGAAQPTEMTTAVTDWVCSDPIKCTQWKAEMRIERAEFARTHPDLHPKSKPEIISSFATGTKGLK